MHEVSNNIIKAVQDNVIAFQRSTMGTHSFIILKPPINANAAS